MALTCSRCGNPGEAPAAHRVAFLGSEKDRVLSGICLTCWKDWETMEIKVINEYRLNFMDPEHRAHLKRSCLEFLNLALPS